MFLYKCILHSSSYFYKADILFCTKLPRKFPEIKYCLFLFPVPFFVLSVKNDRILIFFFCRDILMKKKVEYSLTAFGESFIPVLQAMMAWSEACLCPDWQNPYEHKR